MRVISAEDAAEAACRLAGQKRPGPPASGARDTLSAWRARFTQLRPDRGPGGRSSMENCQNGDGSNGSNNNCDPDGAYAGEPGSPIALWLELVESCNLDCVFCYNPWRPPESSLRGRPLLSPEQLRHSLARFFARVPVRHVTLSGGEPLMYGQIESLTRYVSRHCDSVGMTTNGRSLTRRRIAALKEAGLTSVCVPVHSPSADVHDALAGGRSWRSAVRALAFSLEAGLATSLSCVVTRQNLDDVGAVARMALDLGIGTVVLNSFHATGQGTGREQLGVSAAEFAALVEALRTDVGDAADVVVGSPPPADDDGRRRRISRITVSPFGELKLCSQSSGGVVSVQTEPDAFEEFLDAVSRHDFGGYVDRIDSCTCH